MPYQLNEEIIFPHPELAREDGLLAFGGDLSIHRLLLAYQHGIFPWYNEDEPILWWSPDPRFVLFPEKIKVSKSMKQVLRRNTFEVSFDLNFEYVIQQCGTVDRPGQLGTWISPEMIQAYIELHQAGFAHSVEVWQNGEIVGGLYGVSLGKMFFGESMFAHVSNASKTGFITLAKVLEEKGFTLIDCQLETKHLASLGAEMIPKSSFIKKLSINELESTYQGKWTTWAKKQQL